MALIEIKKQRRHDYDNEYELSLNTTQVLTAEEYTKIIMAIETISGILDPYFDTLPKTKKEDE